MPLTNTCRTPVGSSAVRRSASAGKSRTRRVGPGADRLRIEHAHVGPVSLAQVAATREAEHVGGFAGQLAHRVLERHDLTLAYPCAQQVGGERRVAQLVDVRARVGEAERDVLVREQLADCFDVVVGDVRTKARLEILGEREIAHHVERARAALAREVTHPAALAARGTASTPTPRTSPSAASSATLRDPPRHGPARRDRGTPRDAPRGSPSSAPRTPCRC